MRNGVTGLLAGLVAGVILAGGVAFAVESASTGGVPQGTRSDIAASHEGTRSDTPTPSVETTVAGPRHSPDATPTVQHRQGERVMSTVRTTQPMHTPATEPPQHVADMPQVADMPHVAQPNPEPITDGTVCAPTTSPMHESPAPQPAAGEHHEGMRHE